MDNNTNNNGQNITGKPSKFANDGISIMEILLTCLNKWYYFVISVFATVLIASLYIASTAPTYVSSACLLIKQDRRTGSNGADATSMGFNNMGKLFAQQTNVSNEIIAFKSPALMQEVVKRLDLRANYTTPQRLYHKTLYGKALPVKVSMIDFPDESSMELTLKYLNRDSVIIYKMKNYIGGEKMEYDEMIKVHFQDTVKTPVGELAIVPTMGFYDKADPAFNDITLRYGTLSSAVVACSSGLGVELTDKDATAITLSKSDRSYARAKDILSMLITVYNEKWVNDQNQIAVSTSEFINDRLIVIEQELGDVDSDISQFKSRNQLLDPVMTGSMYITQAGQMRSDISELENYLSLASYIREYMASSASTNQLLPANSGIENSNIEVQISEYNTIQLKRNNLVANSSVDNPVVINLDAELSALHENIVASIDNYIVILKKRIESLKKVESQNAEKISNSPLQAEHLTNIERQQKVKESLYLFLLQKREENELSQAFTAYNTRILTPPGGGSAPVAPQSSKILLIALLLGLAIPAVWIYLQESLSNTVRGRKDIEDMIVPFAGEIPLAYQGSKFHNPFNKNKKSNDMVVVKARSRDIINEAFRVARANIEFMCSKNECNVFMTTSFNIGSGKSFCSINLAIALALKDKKVCLVDMDLRKRTISRYVHARNIGVTEYLSGRASDIDSILMKGVLANNLDILPTGSIPPNPTELLYTPNFSKMMDYLRAHYDYVFLDCPPSEIVADASIIRDYANHTLFIVRAGLFDRRMLPGIEKYYEQKKFNGMVLLLNGTPINNLGHYNRYGYNYGHRYSYGESYGASVAYGTETTSAGGHRKATGEVVDNEKSRV
ncbi:MAG: polysaccharide biosynthesis tyrosine autokinase [Bacteroidales bacterium]|nr:polysaccharide biosynthesis tyrosine autokinase [Bacteroidales bacterium]